MPLAYLINPKKCWSLKVNQWQDFAKSSAHLVIGGGVGGVGGLFFRQPNPIPLNVPCCSIEQFNGLKTDCSLANVLEDNSFLSFEKLLNA